MLFSENSKAKCVYLGFGYHNLSSYYNSYITGIYSKTISLNYLIYTLLG